MPRTVVAYMTHWCPDCSRSRRLLQKLGIAFTEIDVERVEGAEDEMRRRNGGSGKVPTVLVGDLVLIEPTDADLERALQAEGD